MDFDDQLRRYFGSDDLAAITPAALAGGIERMEVDFGLAADAPRRFALWTLMYVLGSAPELDQAFPDPAEREAARSFMDLAARAGTA